MEALPLSNIPYDPYFPDLIEAYFIAGNTDKAVALTNDFCNHYYEQLDYYLKQDPYIVSSALYEIQIAIQFTSRIADACSDAGRTELAESINNKITGYYTTYMNMQVPAAQ